LNKLKEYLSDFFFSVFLKVFQQKTIKQNILSPNQVKILIIHFGDRQQALSVTPIFKIIKSNIASSITILATNNNSEAFANNPFIDKLILSEEGFRRITKSLFELNRQKFDVIIDSHETQNKVASIIIGLLRTKFKVGFINGNEKLLTHKFPKLNINKTHSVDRLLRLTEAFNMVVNKAELNIIYNTTDKSQKAIENYLITHDFTYKLNALINISNKNEHGFWGIENYKKLLKYLRNYDANIIVAASIEDIETAELIAVGKHTIFYNNDFDIYAELIKKSNFVFSPDSVTIQLAGAYKIPVFCLFVQHRTAEMINVPYNSDFDFALTEKANLKEISFGKVLNSFVPYFEYIYERYNTKLE
jgi:ADP-heptose:LPS heptosyltransferase